MEDEETTTDGSGDLRRRAAQRLAERGEPDPSGWTREQLEHAFRQARLRQAELEIQNEEFLGLDRELTHQNQLLETLVEAIPVMVAIYDPQLRYFRINRQLRETLGWTQEDAATPDFMAEVYPDPELRDAVERFMKQLEPGWRDFPARAKDGTIVDASWANVGLADETRIGIGVDIRERKRRENQLASLNARLADHVARRSGELQHSIVQLEVEAARRERAERTLEDRSRLLEAFFEHSMSPLAFLDRHLVLFRVNAAFADAMEIEREQLVGQVYTSLGIDEPERAIFEAVLETGRPERRTAQRFARPRADDGGCSYWNWALIPLASGDGRVDELVLTLEDVTGETRTREQLEAANMELSRLADQLRSLTMQLAEAEDRERRHLAEVLHADLQQLLTGARYQLGALFRRLDDDAARSRVDRVAKLIEESASKARTLSHELRPAVLDQSDLAPAVEWLVKDMAKKHGLDVELDLPREGAPCLSSGLKLFVYKALRELLFNVAKHAGRSEARIRLHYGTGELVLEVEDEGDGFNCETLAVPGTDGTGFGLFGIRQRLQLLGGDLRVDSAPGAGTRVRLRAPLSAGGRGSAAGTADRVPVDHPSSSGEPEAGQADRIRVMVVDDHPETRSGVIALLGQDPSLELVAECRDGREAIDEARRLEPDLVLMDIAMPEVDGIAATDAITRDAPSCTVIGLSMYDDQDLRRRMVGAGAEACLSKSEAPEGLLEAIRRALGS